MLGEESRNGNQSRWKEEMFKVAVKKETAKFEGGGRGVKRFPLGTLNQKGKRETRSRREQ